MRDRTCSTPDGGERVWAVCAALGCTSLAVAVLITSERVGKSVANTSTGGFRGGAAGPKHIMMSAVIRTHIGTPTRTVCTRSSNPYASNPHTARASDIPYAWRCGWVGVRKELRRHCTARALYS